MITREMFLHTITPALERYKARGVNNTHVCGDSNMNLVFSGVKDYVLLALLHATPAEEHRFMKWYRNHAPREDKGGLLVIQGNDYNRLGDYTGAVICHMASTSANEFQCGKESLVSAIKYLLIREHGQKQGLAYYQRFLEILVSAANPEAKKELAAVKKEIAELDKKAPASNAQQPHKMGEKK
ncbi:TPA: hypothetical protein DDW35_05045 [Candidatus Sumerlaeota bacterium]|nr:hypothetical protein [Candidatus Sumerlaeota bacterium]